MREGASPSLTSLDYIDPILLFESFWGRGAGEPSFFKKGFPPIIIFKSYLFQDYLRFGVGGAVLFDGAEVVDAVVVCHIDLELFAHGSL